MSSLDEQPLDEMGQCYVGGFIDVAIEVELNRDLRALVGAEGAQFVDVLDAGDAVFDRLGDLVLDDLHRGTSVSACGVYNARHE